MNMTERYYGDFKSRIDNTSWHIEIMQEGTFTATEVVLQRDSVKIEWKTQDRLEPIRSSSATVQLISSSDRQFIDLYSIAVKNVRLDVYRSGSLYWSGTLDTEQYEEPYSTPKGYVVSLTFSDFGVLDRLNVTGTGFTTMSDFITYCATQSGISYGSVNYYISTKLNTDDTSDVFQTATILYDNFYDEDDKADSINDALEYVLRPFAAMIIQKAGNIYVFDYNSISSLTASSVTWSDTSSVLTTGKVYNNVTVEWSPYAKTELVSMDVDEDSVPETTGMTVCVDENSSNSSLTGFTIYASDTGTGVTKSQGKFFKIVSDYSGSDSAGIAWSIMHGASQSLSPYLGTAAPAASTTGTLFALKDRFYVSTSNRDRFRIKLSMSLMADVRYNPFEKESAYNEEGDYDEMKERCNFVYIPIRITLYDKRTGGTALYHFVNKNVKTSGSIPVATGWVAGASTDWSDAWLCWYNTEDRKSDTGIGGWATNKTTIGITTDDLPTAYTERSDYRIVLPLFNGYVQLEIGDGFYSYDSSGAVSDIYDEVRFLLYKDLKASYVTRSGGEVNLNDYTTKAWINEAAKEDYSVKIHIGSTDEIAYTLPSAKGALFNSSNVEVSTICRAGVTDTVQRLLCGSVYSQFAARSAELKGNIRIKPAFGVWSDAHTSGKFFCNGEEQDLGAGTSNMSMIELKADSYSGIKWDNT